jgi:hypothetical protein
MTSGRYLTGALLGGYFPGEITGVPGMSPEPPSRANDHHQQQPAKMKLAKALNPQATHENTLVMRSSAAPLPVLGPGGPAIRVSLPPENLG